MNKKIIKSAAVALLLAVTGFSQTNEEQYAKALKFRTAFNYKEALPLYQALLKSDSSNVNYLTGTSYCLTKYAYYYLPEADKMNYYKQAGYLAQKAIKASEASADGHYVYALALGRIYENASSKVKIANAKLIKSEVDRSIALNPKNAGAYHILGRWHRTVAGFNGFEKAMINAFFGGVPEGGSYDDAVKSFTTAIGLEPKFILHQYELAETYHEMGKDVEARIWANSALKITPTCEDDNKAKNETETLLKKLK